VVLPRQQLTDDSEILDFLLAHVGWFDMYVEDEYAALVRYFASKTRWMRKFSAPASSRRSSTSNSPGDRPGGSLLCRYEAMTATQ
jgi:hypothetical protein